MKVKLPTEVTIHHVAELKQALLAAVRSGEPIELDPTDVREVDVAGIQLLCALHRETCRRGTSITFSDPQAAGATIGAVRDKAGFRRKMGCAPGCLWLEKKHG